MNLKTCTACLLFLPFCAGAQFYTNLSSSLPIPGANAQSMDLRAADLDGDGDLDLVFANEGKPNNMLINNGAGSFTNAANGWLPQEVHDSEDVAIADFDGDGDLDLVFCSEDDVTLGVTNVHEFYLNDGTGHFTVAAYQPPDSEANAVITADLTGDGLPDLLFGNNGPEFFLKNNGDGTFSDESTTRIPAFDDTTQDLLLCDVDGDGDLDLVAGNEDNNRLYFNDGTGHFSDSTTTHLPQNLNTETRKVSAGDIDNDGDLDLFLANVRFIPTKNPQNRLLLNDGTGHFTDATATQLPTDGDDTLDGIFEDVDYDDDLDLVLANANLQVNSPQKIYLNDGAGYFTNTPNLLPGNIITPALGVIAADLTGDGVRDLFFCVRNLNGSAAQRALFFKHTDLPSATAEAATMGKWSLSPNPSDSGDVLLKGKLPKDAKLVLVTTDGKEIGAIVPQKVDEALWRLPLETGLAAGLRSGLYFVCLRSAAGGCVAMLRL
jgi:hypothetical protein